ncbi:MAG: CoA pyrophosphatase [Geobacteraceae bacterium]
MPIIDDISRGLAARSPRLIPHAGITRTAVALILKPGKQGPDLLFILRASHDADPWSGNIAFPGGRMEAADRSLRITAERETMEELGLNLRSATLLGRLDDTMGAHLPVLVSCFVYVVSDSPSLTPNHEVARYFWFPLADLFAPHRHREVKLFFGGKLHLCPAIDLLTPEEPVLWGITYRIVMQLLTILEQPTMHYAARSDESL